MAISTMQEISSKNHSHIYLSSVPEKKKVQFLGVDGGGRGIRNRLAALGLVPGVEIEVIRNHGWGCCILSVKGSRIVLGRGMASRIQVI
ncbi:MAG: ferrous iron transport protein A [Candidatus Sumerlaeia bacterium]